MPGDEAAWAASLAARSRAELAAMSSLERRGGRDEVRRVLAAVQRRLERYLARGQGDAHWHRGLYMLAAVARHRAEGDGAALDELAGAMAPLLSAEGEWRVPLSGLPQAMYGHALLCLLRARPNESHRRAAQRMAEHYLRAYPRADDGALPYQAARRELLVDSLGMLPPFLAAYARDFDAPEAAALACRQLTSFIACNVDADSGLPFHGYYAGGPYRLGLHGWGRGVGWYLLGLAETLPQLPDGHAAVPTLKAALQRAAIGLRSLQRPDGHWAWCALMPEETRDASATSFCGYALARAVRVGLLGSDLAPCLDRASEALRRATRADGAVDGSSGECRGLGNYSMLFGPQPWLQATAACFACAWPSSGGLNEPARPSRASGQAR